jgi:hypothetical protein
MPTLSPTGAPTPSPTPLPTSGSWVKVSRDVFDGAVGTGHAAISCGDLQQRTTYLDCVVGDADGYVYLYSDQYASTDTADYKFEQVFGSDFNYSTLALGQDQVVPSCLDFEKEDKFSCVYGAANGRVYYMVNSGGEGQFKEEDFDEDNKFTLIKTRQENAAPFCADFDGDNDIDCIVGYDNGVQDDTGVQYWENLCNSRYCTYSDGTNFTQSTSMSWSSGTTNFFGSAYQASIRYPKPFCIDMDEDDDLDCLI